MVNAPAGTLLTADDLLAMPDDGNQYELVRGRLVTMSPSSSKPAMVAAKVLRRMGSFVEDRQLGAYGGTDFGFRLRSDPDTVQSPDCAFIQAARVPATGIPDGFWVGAPDLAVEVLSPSNRVGEILHKVAEYLEAGTRLVWVIDPEARTAVIYRPDGLPAIAGATDTLSGEDVLPGFTLALPEIWVA